MSKKLKITTTVIDVNTGQLLSKQESIIETEEPKAKNHFGLKNTGHDLSHLDHLKKYCTDNEPITDSHNIAISKVDLNDEVLAAYREDTEKYCGNNTTFVPEPKIIDGMHTTGYEIYAGGGGSIK